MASCLEQATEVMRSTASFHRNHAGRKLGYIVDERLTPHGTTNDDGSARVNTDHAARVLAEIDTKDNDRHLPAPFLSDAGIIFDIRVIGAGHTIIYELIGAGELETIKIGRRTLVKTDSIRALVDRAA